jgi:hypothetical protein
MSYDWREIRKNGEYAAFLPDIWERECSMPAWYKASSFLWTPNYGRFVEWAASSQEIWGLFKGEKLVTCLYIELQTEPHIAAIHLSMLEKLPQDVFVKEYSKLRDQLFRRGIKIIRGWTLKKNWPLRRLMEGIGFRRAGLRFDQGEAHSRVLTWELMEVICRGV